MDVVSCAGMFDVNKNFLNCAIFESSERFFEIVDGFERFRFTKFR